MPKGLHLAKIEPYDVPTPKAVYNLKVYLIALMGCAAALNYGYDLGFIGTTKSLESFEEYMGMLGPANKAFATDFGSNIVTMFTAGAVVGSAIFGPFTGKFGRKPINIACAGLFIFGSIIQSCAGMGSSNPHAMILGGRFLNGISVGGSNTVAPYIVSEMSPPSIRGRLVGIYEIGVQLGTCLGFWICYGLLHNHVADEWQWRIPFFLQLIMGGLYLIGAFLIPESPRYMAKYGRARVLSSLSYIRNLPEDDVWLNLEADDVQRQYEMEKQLVGWKGFFREIRAKSIRNRLIMITFLFIFFQFSGTNSVNYYSPTIFRSFGVTGQSVSFLATGVYGIIRLVAILIAMGYAVDAFGRRKLLMIFGGLMGVCMWIIGALVKTKSGGYIAPLIMIYIYAAAFCFSFAGIPYIINAEIWPQRLRPYCISYGVFVHWIMNLIIGKITPYAVASMKYGFFWFYAGFLSLSVVFTYFFIPETAGVSLEQMETLFGGHSPAAVQEPGLNRSDSDSQGEFSNDKHVEQRV